MPSSTEGVYQKNSNLIDYYGNPLDLTKYNLLGPTGPAGSTGQDLFFVPGGTGTVERILPDGFTATDSSTPTSLVYSLDLAGLLDVQGQVITFNTIQTTEDSSGNFINTSIAFQNFSSPGTTSTQTLFVINNDPSIQGIYAARIKPDRDPNLSPTGFASVEQINWVQTDFEISRVSSSIIIRAKIYAYDAEDQYAFGQARFPQKTWILNSGGIYNGLCRLRFSVTPDGAGCSIGIRNILRFNAF
jgi:hypothetical protein